MVEDDVGQQRADNTPLGGTNRRGLEHAIFHHACTKELLDQIKDVAVGDLSRDCLLDDGMWQFIEERLNVGIKYDSIALIVEFQDSCQCHVTVASRSEAKGRVVKMPFEDRLQQSSDDFFRNANSDGGNHQRAVLSFYCTDVLKMRKT